MEVNVFKNYGERKKEVYPEITSFEIEEFIVEDIFFIKRKKDYPKVFWELK
jgi:hypothetical protein